MKTLIHTAFLILISIPALSQINGYYDDFEDGVQDMFWKADHPGTFGISEGDGSLNIAYVRSAESGEWDNFNFTPPESIDVSENPVIIFKIKSDVATTFTVKPIYSNGNDGWLPKEIPADGEWHIYTYELVADNYSGGYLNKIYLYFDGGSTVINSGLVQFDFIQIAGFSIKINNLQANLVDSSTVDLSWETSDPENTDHFNIYRSTEMEFSAEMLTKIGETIETNYQDTGLINHTTYYYKVTATDMNGKEHSPAEVSIQTSNPGSVPIVEIVSENANPVGSYEKYELVVNLLDATFTNPYNPEEIDLYAWFYSPDGDSVKMNGFYDNYQGRDQWKIRFAARQAGSWEYQVFASDADGSGSSEKQTFSVVESNNKGWLTISPDNSNYLMHDNGSSFYGVSVYYPWSVTESGLDEFAAVDGNFFGYWDCTFDGSGNGGGRYLLESMESGVGRYDQRKAARIDEVLSWAEARDLKVMLAIWAHPYLRVENVPWDGAKWFENNPYSKLVDIDDIYTDSLALSFQEKHYRYMIARWGYSQSLGIWEIINEMHGTTGWVRKQAASKKWVADVHAYFKENDPFQRPTTASFGGSEGASHFNETDQLGDMPNVHFYEEHGWPTRYPGDVVRSGLANMVSETRKLKSKGERPAFLGEAGYTSMLADHTTEAYTWELHNTFWAGLSLGMASTPFWWELNTKDVLTASRLQEYRRFNSFVSDIDFAHQLFVPTEIWVENTDGYFMGASNTGFGWMRTYEKAPVSGAPIYISHTELTNGTYLLEWFNTWTGETVDTDTAICVDGITWGKVPDDLDELDVAFKTGKVEGGGSASQIHLQLVKTDTLVKAQQSWLPDIDSTIFKIVCYTTDHNGFLDVSYYGPVDISMEGEGQPEPFTLDLVEGGVVFDFNRMGSSGVTITATIEGLGSAVLYIEGITGVDNGLTQIVNARAELKNNYPNPFDQGTVIGYALPSETRVKLAIYNAQGKLLETLVEGQRSAGQHSVEWNAEGHPAGLYFYTLSSDRFSYTKRCMILK